MKLGTNIKRVEKKRILLRLFVLQNNASLKLLVSKLYPLYDVKKVIDILIKIGTNI